LFFEKQKRTYCKSFLGQHAKEPARMTDKARVQERKQTMRKVSVKIPSENLIDEPDKRRTKLLKQKIQPEPHMAKDASVSSPKHVDEQETLSSFPKVDSETEKW
jgi:ABC-type uncharacterized transport system involved in gliding motility auxiliary subunit